MIICSRKRCRLYNPFVMVGHIYPPIVPIPNILPAYPREYPTPNPDDKTMTQQRSAELSYALVKIFIQPESAYRQIVFPW